MGIIGLYAKLHNYKIRCTNEIAHRNNIKISINYLE